MIAPNAYRDLHLHGGFVIRTIEFTREPMVDALGRAAVAQTTIRGREFKVLIGHQPGEEELSVTLYHEILEAAAVASPQPPASIADFNEGDFEQAAHSAHKQWGEATPENLNRLLQFHGFQGE